ncbi:MULTISPECIES: transposase [Methylobacterium]|uniref:Transposase n=1 Tax=Methylobacterium oryzae CBMB20 TaxID=693986 RepID=A0A089P0K0_9HYPH|nr:MULTISPECIES: transposase [Methylobacterium]AIQ93192.1 Putative transposase [Methylobacterium oryzae CBMB20]SFF23187.1 transposase [Methylobacterium sp. 13MFTsu3.1M2]
MRVEVLGGVERRRRWSFEEKARIVEASYAAKTSVSALARRYGIALGLLFTWRRQAREGQLGGAEQAPVFVPVVTKPELDPGSCVTNLPASAPADEHPRRRRRAGVIKIDLGCGRLLKVDRDVNAEALRRVLSVLEGR